MEEQKLSIREQLEKALDGRTQRWLSFEVRIAEADLSRKLKGTMDFTQAELDRINARLGSNISND